MRSDAGGVGNQGMLALSSPLRREGPGKIKGIRSDAV